MNHLLRERAPITDAAWQEIDREARARVVPALAARRLVDFTGPGGWAHSAVNIGRSDDIDAPAEGLRARQRRVMPLVEVRAAFALSRTELEDFDRGATDIDLAPLDHAAARIARAENIAVFHGWPTAGITGLAAGTFPPVPLPGDYRGYPAAVARAVEQLRTEGINGPYGLALGPDAYTGVVGSAEDAGLLVFDHLHRVLEGPVVWAPGVSGGVVVSLRGGDFTLHVGEDLAVGYHHHDADVVHLYLEESFTFVVTTAEAAVTLSP
ncbi:MAG TPA: family 1 encapsulin nanocompartment shell protein [Acidimicrobiales bacterium]|nr:family 1 encapsulin nanocompartment shell protein [Acidimicrobiales bacterium]